MKIFLLISLACAHAWARPDLPTGWVEMRSLDPVILTWVKAEPHKDLTEVPTLTVQTYSLTEKLRRLFSDHKSQGSCFEMRDKEWEQTWCEKKNLAYVILSKNQTPELVEQRKKLLSWIRDD